MMNGDLITDCVVGRCGDLPAMTNDSVIASEAMQSYFLGMVAS